MTFESYKNVLVNSAMIRNYQYSIISKKHELQTICQNKVSLSAFYDKKYLLSDGISSYSYGHQKIDSDEEK